MFFVPLDRRDRRTRTHILSVGLVFSIFVISFMPQTALALPSFARQSGMSCADCHVGAIGPELTSTGRMFKLGGYTATNTDKWIPPFSGMAIGSYTHVGADVPGGAGPYDKPNNNFAIDEISAFLAGKITGPIGAMIQATWSGTDHHLALDNADIRYARTTDHGDIIGVSINNNPTIQDAWNSTPGWGFPYTGTAVAPSPVAAPLLAGGLEQQVVGASAYALWQETYYVEVGNYISLAPRTLSALGIGDDVGKIKGIAPYWRLAYTRDTDSGSLALGTFGMYTKIAPDRSQSITDKSTDLGLDASYQFFDSDRYVASLHSSYIHEWRKQDASVAAGDAANRKDSLNSVKIDAAVSYHQTYGATLGWFDTWGARDPLLFAPGDIDGSRTGKPNSSGFVMQADWTPFGKDGSWGAPWANLRLGLQYTLYTKFNGASSNYDGFGRSASDNNSLFLFLWSAF